MIFFNASPFIPVEQLLPFPIQLLEHFRGHQSHDTVQGIMGRNPVFQPYIFAQVVLIFISLWHCLEMKKRAIE